jgi:hypothetical protein
MVLPGITLGEVSIMSTRNRAVISLSLPPEMAEEYRAFARARGTSASELFREMFQEYRRRRLVKEYRALQGYGVAKAPEAGFTDEDIERLVFRDR